MAAGCACSPPSSGSPATDDGSTGRACRSASTGRWDIEVRGLIDGIVHVGQAHLDVSPDDGTPALGSLVPGGDTPTMRDAHSLMHHISSDPEPLTAFYTWSLDDALRRVSPRSS